MMKKCCTSSNIIYTKLAHISLMKKKKTKEVLEKQSRKPQMGKGKPRKYPKDNRVGK